MNNCAGRETGKRKLILVRSYWIRKLVQMAESGRIECRGIQILGKLLKQLQECGGIRGQAGWNEHEGSAQLRKDTQSKFRNDQQKGFLFADELLRHRVPCWLNWVTHDCAQALHQTVEARTRASATTQFYVVLNRSRFRDCSIQIKVTGTVAHIAFLQGGDRIFSPA